MADDEKMSRQEAGVKVGKPLLKITTRIFTGMSQRAEKPLLIPMVKTFMKKSVKKAVRHEITINENKAKASRNPGGFHFI
ncbi:hypothetical protein M3699_22460 [Peribacillus simplex]|uniref:hypothetical protein n=1 Tax=Peribacillus simplex TaxID=1478 RepID=UPI00203B8674|nr:hypothetical protein [Peribacillus simplex]MCM3676540.1 hypothetical protein [Peribacillus simplex]